MAETRIILTAPMPDNINSNKGRTHWRARDRLRKEYFMRLDDLQGCGLIRPPDRILRRVTIRSVMYLGNYMDDDNAVARHKPLLDWLKTRGYIVDDNRKYLRWEGFPEQIVRRNGEYRIELTITEAAA